MANYNTGTYPESLRKEIVLLGINLVKTCRLRLVIPKSHELSEKYNYRAGAISDRVRNVIWEESNGTNGRDNKHCGVSWVKPLIQQIKG